MLELKTVFNNFGKGLRERGKIAIITHFLFHRIRRIKSSSLGVSDVFMGRTITRKLFSERVRGIIFAILIAKKIDLGCATIIARRNFLVLYNGLTYYIRLCTDAQASDFE